ncbi:MAG: Dabb family protein [Selenomonadaceae bacterium]|nr:Dabb family protein [Selenomonadaceae bacterium]
MIRHIFIGTFKADVSDEIKNRVRDDLRAMKKNIPGIIDLHADFSTGWVGSENSVVMTVDMATKADFDVYMTHPYHTEHIAKLGEAYVSSYVAAQFEL